MALFAALIFIVGMAFTRSGGSNTKSFFAAGGQTPWWISGLSLFMSYFSAGTFVVWGSIAYKFGWVAITIQFTMCLGGLVTALYIAPRWKRAGVLTAAEYIGQRLGTPVQQFYMYLVLLLGLFSTGAVLYPVGKIVYLATPFSLTTCIIGLGVMVILYTAAGGLWAVLVTDVIQFIILTAAVLMVIPLAFDQVGGVSEFLRQTPDGFFRVVTDDYPLAFMLAYVVYQIVFIGGNWAYIQRYTSVADEKSAKKVGYLFTALYLVSPILWMLPPMIYRVMNPDLQGLEAEGAYLLLCQKVLPTGMMGLMLSAMIAATASSANTTLNLIAAVCTNDVYKKLLHPNASDKTLMVVARLATILFGVCTIVIALMVPAAGGLVEVVLSIGAIAGGALFAPIIWTLFSKRQTAASIFMITAVSLLVSLIFKFLTPALVDFRLNRTEETVVGVGLPVVLLVLYEWYANQRNQSSADFVRYQQQLAAKKVQPVSIASEAETLAQNAFSFRVIALATAVIGVGMIGLSFAAGKGVWVVAACGVIIVMAAYPVWRLSAKRVKTKTTDIIHALGKGHSSNQEIVK